MKQIKWTYDRCQEEALKYKTRTDFKNNSSSAHSKCIKMKWLDDVTKHMKTLKHKWTYKDCQQEALKYKSRMDFKRESSGMYTKSVKMKWLNDICKHMEVKIRPDGYWTYDKCKEEALKYEWRQDFARAKGWGYNVALQNGWLDDICKHMNICGNLKKRCIYAYIFDDNVVYVGLTYNFEKRWNKRLLDKNDAVTLYIQHTGKEPERVQLTDYLDVADARLLEGVYVENYRNDGFTILNRSKTGSLGGNFLKWSYTKCKSEIMKYKTYKAFKKNNYNCLASIYKNGWVELLSPLKRSRKANNYWNKEKCKELAKTCSRKKDFYKRFRGAYAAAKVKGWFEEITNHMKQYGIPQN